MGRKRRCARGMADDARLHRNQTGASGQQMVGANAGGAAAAEGGALSAPQETLARDAPAGALGGRERLGDERLGAR